MTTAGIVVGNGLVAVLAYCANLLWTIDRQMRRPWPYSKLTGPDR